MQKHFVKLNIFVVLIHAVGWILFLLLPIVFLGGNSNDINFRDFIFSAPYVTYVLLYAGIFYLHNYVLLQGLYFHGHKVFYFLILILLGISVLMIRPFDSVMNLNRNKGISVAASQTYMPPHSGQAPPPRQMQEDMRNMPPAHRWYGHRPPVPQGGLLAPPFSDHPDIIAFFLYLLFIAMGVLTEGSRKLQKTQQLLLETASERSKAELTFLKAQINPHFIFNTLNNIYSLAESRAEETPEAILKLSGIMRYILDNMNDTLVPLADEIECINDYIYLQRLRLGKNTHLQYVLKNPEKHLLIAPLLLISFIENVFKYGISKRQYSPVNIRLEIREDMLTFSTENKMFGNAGAAGSGLGISNTRKRLDLMYAGQYQLEILNDGNIFRTYLRLKLQEQ